MWLLGFSLRGKHHQHNEGWITRELLYLDGVQRHYFCCSWSGSPPTATKAVYLGSYITMQNSPLCKKISTRSTCF